MTKEIPQQTFDAGIDALSENDKERALLLYHRASQKSLEQAWQDVQALFIDLGEDANDLPEKPDDDLAFDTVQRYLTEPAAKRRKDKLLWLVHNSEPSRSNTVRFHLKCLKCTLARQGVTFKGSLPSSGLL